MLLILNAFKIPETCKKPNAKTKGIWFFKATLDGLMSPLRATQRWNSTKQSFVIPKRNPEFQRHTNLKGRFLGFAWSFLNIFPLLSRYYMTWNMFRNDQANPKPTAISLWEEKWNTKPM